MKTKFFQKFFSVVNIISLTLQLIAPLVTFSPIPAFAAIDPTITWNVDKNSFKISGIDSYSLYYQTDSKTELVNGSKTEVYAGTCSTGGTCTPETPLRGILKSGTSDQVFTINSNALSVIQTISTTASDLTAEEMTWLSNPTPENLAKLTQTTPNSIPAPPENSSTSSGQTVTPPVSTSSAVTTDQPLVSEQKGKLSVSLLDGPVSPSIFTNQADYSPTGTAIISGSGLTPNTPYTLVITSDNLVYTATVVTNMNGTFTYSYQLDGIYRPNYKVEVVLGNTIIATTAFTDSASVTTTLSGVACMADQPGQTGLTCTANDISIATVSGITIIGHGCRFPGDTIDFTANWQIQSNANNRYNVGLWFATNGQTNALHGTCSVTSLPSTPNPPFFDGGSSCGGINKPDPGTLSITQTAICNPDSNGFLKLPYCTSWQQNSGACTTPTDTVPGAPSKCNCNNGFSIPITVPPSIEVIKSLSPSNDAGLFNLQVNSTTDATDVGNNGTTGKQTVIVGSNTVGETAGTSTSLSNYTSGVSCVLRGTQTTVSTTGTNPWTLNVTNGQDIVCTITNTRNSGSVELKKVWSGAGGQTTLNIGTSANGTNVASTLTGTNGGTPLTTGTVAVNTGTYYFSETGGLSNYSSALACTDNGNPVTPGANNSLEVSLGHAVICTFTNTLNTGNITISKTTIGGDATFGYTSTIPSNSSFSILTTSGTGSQTFNNVVVGSYTVTESTLAGWNLTNLDCTGGAGPYATSLANRQVSITLNTDESVTCTFTNTKIPTLTVNKVLSPSNDPGLFNLQIDSVTKASGVGNGGTTGAQNVTIGTHNVSETAGISTNLSNYTAVISGDCATDGTITLAAGDVKTCTITNTRNTGSIELKKAWSGTAGQTTLNIGTTASGTDIANTQTGTNGSSPLTTGTKTVNTGTYYVSETDGLTNYDSDLVCTDNTSPMTIGTNDSVVVTTGHTVVCTFTNTRQTGSVKVNKLVDTDGNGTFETSNPTDFTWSLDTLGTNAMGGTVSGVDTGSHSVTENSVTNYHFVGWYQTSSRNFSCAQPEGTILPVSVSVTTGATTEITLCNAVNTGTVIVHKDVQGPTGQDVTDTSTNFQVSLDGGTGQDITDNSTVTYTNVIAGSHNVTESLISTDYTLYGIGTSAGVSGNTSGLTISVTYGGTTNVYVTNRQKYGSITVHKLVDRDANGTFEDTDPTDFTWTLGSAGANVMGSTDSTVVPGDHQVGENDVSGYHFVGWYPTTGTGFSCANPQSTVLPINVNVGPNGTSDFTLCNARDTGTLTVIKSLSPSDDPGKFNLNIDDVTYKTDAGENDSTGAITVLTGSHTASESAGTGTVLSDYTSSISCNNDYFGSGNSLNVDVSTGSDVVCTVTNTRNQGKLLVHKLQDLTGDGKYGTLDSKDFTWGTVLGTTNYAMGGSGETLNTGPYNVYESSVAGYQFTGWFYGDPRENDFGCTDLPQGDQYKSLPTNLAVANGETTEITLCNQFQNPILTISKTNDAGGDKSPGDSVVFTLTISATQSAAFNVFVTDLLAGGFKYHSGTWSATKNGVPFSVPEPVYHSPGVWTLGNMALNDVIVLKYTADISGDEKPGLYKDLAWAAGCKTDTSCSVNDTNSVLSNAVDPGFIADNFVGTQVNVVTNDQSTTSVAGQVLGASTSLPATGGNSVWPILATLLLLSGTTLVYFGLKKRYV